ncbi:MAG: hypothetical protein WB780_16675 [Candidatus Acidiferrales bacterium]
MPKLLGIIGLLVICAGLDLLWQSRHEIKFWVVAYVNVFRAMLRHQESPLKAIPEDVSAEKRQGALRVLLGMGFAFFLGPILLALGVTLLLFPHL